MPQRRHFNPASVHRTRVGASPYVANVATKKTSAAASSPVPQQAANNSTDADAARRPQRPAPLGVWGYVKFKFWQVPTKYWIIFVILLVLNSRRIYGLVTEVTDPVKAAARHQQTQQQQHRPKTVFASESSGSVNSGKKLTVEGDADDARRSEL